MATCVVLQHEPAERAYAIADALAAAQVELDVRRLFDGDRVPTTAAGVAGIVVMGGSMSAASDEGFASRTAELALLREALAIEVPVLGVCLGAQLLALAGGGDVYAGPAGIELSWTPVHLDAEAADDPLFQGLPAHLTVLNWHGDTFDLPASAVRLASGDLYRNQAFRIGPRAWGVQFHIEVDGPAVDAFIDAFPEEAAEAGGGGAGLRAATMAALAELRPARDLILARFAGALA